jgi:tetratricopeptide (TPR) repeat protein
LLTGAAITDMLKSNSALGNGLDSLGKSCGLENGGGVILALICTFASLGFPLMYLNLGLVLSPTTALIASLSERGSDMAKYWAAFVSPIPFAERRQNLWLDDTKIDAARVIASRPGAGEEGTPDKLFMDARAFVAVNQLEKAEKALRKALQMRPDDVRIQYELALHLLFTMEGREAESIPLLERVVVRPDAPIVAWKALGFARLWDPSTWSKSARATENYLKLFPDDEEANLWLISARAHTLDAGKDEEKKKFFAQLKELLAKYPFLRERIIAEADDGEQDDFGAWRKEPAFRALLGIDEP